MKLNQLPVTTFEKVGMNEATVDYSEGSFESIEINKDTVLELDKPGDINVKIHVKDKETLSPEESTVCQCPTFPGAIHQCREIQHPQ